ncbi:MULTISPECIES: SDR family oxidoreductase [unclassified Mycobacterium]|uniref:SDR family oxidoreductase n=1 Tax=unclassified Mycobacterium TaxID=2642494 RepID=UPI00074021A3|nr:MULTISPECIES: SDR family oxidoreductase [unclassified Mycobacterium]KUH83910.1 short-chain dehydrogenase [Mycobacterium sp. IS-1556]KUH88495.1 short-chain dehydrogenase [Mycobacterium sp. GA-0227b]KUH89700.1 short-chain dehydrogenase [Mycobacterium sp. GA-1999]
MGQNAQRFVDSSDDVRIAVHEEGNPDGPTLVLVHGWPDSHVLWDGVVPLLADRFRIVRYDNRGVGESTAPKRVSAHRMARYADDFEAVTAAVSSGEPVHVLAHDWGSAAVWEYLARPGASDRVASLTSVAGPSIDHLNRFVIGSLRRPWRPRRFVRALSQFLSFSYMGFFSIPGIAPLAVRGFVANLVRQILLLRDGIPPDQLHHSTTYKDDAAKSVKVYGANYLASMKTGRTNHYVDVPVQLIVNLRDPFVRPYVYDDTKNWVAQLWRRDLAAGHWSPMSHPHAIARSVEQLVDFLDGNPPARELLRAQVGPPREYFSDTLVSVTGAGSGIGRETALAFAREGAEIVVSDLDEGTAKETAAQIAARGGVAHAYTVDVSDADAVERFADLVCAEHGVPDIVVNNAGVGHAGMFLDTPREEYDRVLAINFGGVVNCCRSFGRRLVDRGLGGHVVNISSMAAYSPQQSMNAYATSKAAVFMFGDCLRAELDQADVGLTTVCPGVIDTNIVHTTRFDAPAGKRDKVEARRAQLEKVFAKRRYGPDKVANAIVSAVKKNKPIRPVAPEAHIVYGVAHLLPQVMRSTARGRVV